MLPFKGRSGEARHFNTYKILLRYPKSLKYPKCTHKILGLYPECTQTFLALFNKNASFLANVLEKYQNLYSNFFVDFINHLMINFFFLRSNQKFHSLSILFGSSDKNLINIFCRIYFLR